MTSESLYQKRQVTEWRGKDIYKTKLIGEVWMPLGTVTYQPDGDGFFYTPLPSERVVELNHKTIRRVK